MSDDVRKLLFDITTAIGHIRLHLGESPSFDTFSANLTVRRAVERELSIIGEAMSKLMKLDATLVIGDARRIIGLRNRIIHSYDALDEAIFWGVIQKYVPVLDHDVQALLNSEL